MSKRVVSLVTCLGIMIALVGSSLPASADGITRLLGVIDLQVSLPDGSPFSGTVNLYVELPGGETSVLTGSKVTDDAGRVDFSSQTVMTSFLAAIEEQTGQEVDAEDPALQWANVYVRAIDDEKIFRLNYFSFEVPLRPSLLTAPVIHWDVVADEDMSQHEWAADMSAEEMVGPLVKEDMPVTVLDPVYEETYPDPGREYDEGPGPSGGKGDGKVIRWVDVGSVHASNGMMSNFLIGEGRDSHSQYGFNVCNTGLGCEGWSIGAMRVENQAREISDTRTQYDAFHRTYEAQYLYKKRRSCTGEKDPLSGYCSQWTYFWEQHEYRGYGQGGTRWDIVAGQPGIDESGVHTYFNLGGNETVDTETQDAKTFGFSLTIMGLGLSTRTGYSAISKISWSGLPSCHHRWLYGPTAKMKEAPIVYATDRGRC